MELIELNAKPRETSGKGAARKLRATKVIPAIVYGAKIDPIMLSLQTTEFDKIVRENGTTGLFFKLKIDGDKDRAVMLKEIQMDTFGLNYLHVDLHEIDMDMQVTVTVPVETTGESKGVEDGGMLQIIRRELELYCKPADTPSSVVIDITDLDIGDAVHVEDIDLGDTVEIPHDVNFTVVTVVPPEALEESEEEDDEEVDEETAEDSAEEEAEPASEE